MALPLYSSVYSSDLHAAGIDRWCRQSRLSLAKMINEALPSPYQILGFIDDDQEKVGQLIESFPVVGTSKDLLQKIVEMDISDLVFGISGEVNADLFRNIITAEEQGIEVTSLPVAYEELFGRVPIFLLQSDWILRSFFDELHTTSFYETSKRLIDIFGALIGCLFLVVLFPIIALVVILDSGFPIFYHQPRVGKNGRPYKIYKFRTMVRDAEKGGARTATENDVRITRVGRWLRKSHLDELPQVINILKGEMSLVGPRSEQIELVNQFQEQIPSTERACLFHLALPVGRRSISVMPRR
jgi:hypothetical protein